MNVDLQDRIADLNEWLGSDDKTEDGVTQLITETAGLSEKAKGKQRERQVPHFQKDPV